MKWIVIFLGILIVAAVAGVIYVRTASHDPARWHVDPATVTDVNAANEFLGSETFSAAPDAVASLLKKELGGEVLAGDLSDGWVTIVVRTALIGYPDYVSVRLTAVDDRTRATLYSRSRFGKSDLGANKARVERVFSILKSATGS